MSQILKITPSKNSDHKASASMAWLASLWQGQPKESYRRMLGLPEHISLEIVGTPERLRFQAWAAQPATASLISAHLRAHFPELAVSLAEDALPQPTAWASAELALGMNRRRDLRVTRDQDADPMAGILASVACTGEDQWRMVQVLVRPELEPHLGTLAFQAIIRLVACARDPRLARNGLGAMIAAFGPFGGENTLRPLMIRANAAGALQAIRQRHWPLLRQRAFLLKLEELASIYHIPSPAKVHSPHLETRDIALPAGCFSQRGVRVGTVHADGLAQMVRLEPEALRQHLACFGGTGTGKSTLLNNMAQDLIGLGAGLTVLDPHGTLVSDILAGLPAERLDDVALIRFRDVAYPVGLNVLTARPGFEFRTICACRLSVAGDGRSLPGRTPAELRPG